MLTMLATKPAVLLVFHATWLRPPIFRRRVITPTATFAF
jgi:hypothetical protein